MEHFMNTDIKSFLESLETQEKANEQKLFKKNRGRGFCTKIPKSFFEYPIYQPLKEVILSKNPLYVIPRRWEELDIDFEDISVRNYSVCQQSVLKASNLYNYKKGIKRYEHIAIPLFSPLYDSLYEKYKFQMDIYVFIQIARMIVQGSGYEENIDAHSCKVENVLDILLSNLIKYTYRNHRRLIIECHQLSVNVFELLAKIDSFYQNDRLNKNITLIKNILREAE